MDKEEKLVEEFLKHSGYTDICYEPDGGIPPDFTIRNNIAIEVRRLNQYYNRIENLENLEYNLHGALSDIFSRFNKNF